MWKSISAIIFLTTLYLFPISANEPTNPYPPLAALFGPDRKFICNGIVLAKGRVLTAADCLLFTEKNESQILGQPQDFHVVVGTHNIERFQNGKAFAESARAKVLKKLDQTGKRGKKYDNKYSNDALSDGLTPKESKYFSKAFRAEGFDREWRDNFVDVVNFKVHPEFVAGRSEFDVAVLEIPSSYPLQNSSTVEDHNYALETAYNQTVQVYGWGMLSNGEENGSERVVYLKTRTVDMIVLPPRVCLSRIGSYFVPDQHICLLPKTNETLCFGFTGAPVTLHGKLLGMIQYGEATCSLDSPVVAIRLSPFREFLNIGPKNIFSSVSSTFRKFMRIIMGVFT